MQLKPLSDERVFYDKFLCDKFLCDKFFCSSVRATLTFFSMTSALAQKLACQLLNKCTCHRKTCQSTNFARLYGSTKKTCQSNLSILCDWPADCQSKLVDMFTPVK